MGHEAGDLPGHETERRQEPARPEGVLQGHEGMAHEDRGSAMKHNVATATSASGAG